MDDLELLELDYRAPRRIGFVQPAHRCRQGVKVVFTEITEEDFTKDLSASKTHPVFRPADVPVYQWEEMRRRNNQVYDEYNWWGAD
jgi:hypothetical protein